MNAPQLELDLQLAYPVPDLPSPAQFQAWISAALAQGGWGQEAAAQLTLRIVDEAEGAELNETWRHKPGPTNVLSFPFEAPPGVDIPLLGDMVICAPVVAREAAEQHKTLPQHWAHLVVHGTLHLLGYDHLDEAEAEQMEALETQILRSLDYPDPYRDDSL